MPHFTKLLFLEKLSPSVHFVNSFPIAWMFGIISQSIQKTQSLQILTCSLLQAKHLVITQEKRLGKDGPFLSFATKCKCRTTYDLNVEAISFAIGQGCRSQLI